MMNRDDAYTTLKIAETTSVEEIEEAYIQQLFEVKNFILRSNIIPKLYLSRIKLLTRIHEAFTVLTSNSTAFDLPHIIDHFLSYQEALNILELESNSSNQDFIQSYEKLVSMAKMKLSSSSDALNLIYSINDLVQFQLAFEAILIQLFESIELTGVEAPKQQNQLGTVELKSILESNSLLELSISGSINADDITSESKDRLKLELSRIAVAKSLWK